MKEQLILLRNRERYDEGTYNPLDATQYLACDGFAGLKRALSMTSQEIIEEVKASGLRGRGGAGFPTWRKLQFTVGGDGVKYVVCNADEGEPGTNKDRVLLTVDPCAVFEGMAIAGKAIGAHYGYIYLRAEYRYMFDALKGAIQSCRDNNCLGKDIFGSGFDFDIELRMGNGAYVCGEETALFESIEGKRGEPRFRPPYPATYGLFGKPTVSNNVETLANLAPIFRNGAEWYASFGTEGSTGTKLFTVSGNIYRKGVFELPMGANLKELIYDFCGGIADGRQLLGVQTGGASGAIVNADQIDVALDIDHVSASGGRLACGTIMVYSDKNCIVDVLRNDLDFFREESCGQCTPCREGTFELYRLVSKIAKGQGSVADLDTIEELCEVMKNTSLCGLGVSATVPVSTCISNFRGEFLKHIDGDYCPVCSLNGGKKA
ncbi:MAG: NADH-ubiquinone oxidoreductase-F iron-sulfur binding region domain-containing protein [Oscillospiraceae bacterium]|nr:NADH-ubiquinone oxidoreductase-F iron-sulfur binding region domain-containing protein [Oscillospiraceae bacterium]